MKFRNEKLQQTVNGLTPKKRNSSNRVNVPKPNTTNISGQSAYTLDPFLKLLTLLNVSKLENQFY
jgi:hypothetical protein